MPTAKKRPRRKSSAKSSAALTADRRARLLMLQQHRLVAKGLDHNASIAQIRRQLGKINLELIRIGRSSDIVSCW